MQKSEYGIDDLLPVQISMMFSQALKDHFTVHGILVINDQYQMVVFCNGIFHLHQ